MAPILKLKAGRLVGAVYQFIASVRPAADGIPVVLQRLVGKKWKKIDKNVTDDGLADFTVGIPADVAIEVAAVRPRVEEVRRVDL